VDDVDGNLETGESRGFKGWENLEQSVIPGPLIEIPISDWSAQRVFQWLDHNRRPATSVDQFHQWFERHIGPPDRWHVSRSHEVRAMLVPQTPREG
jgi:hypothetical protein